MNIIKYRLFEPRLAPRQTRVEVPGWTGNKETRQNGAREQPWHCLPFIEGAQCGIELFYPHDHELHVTTRGGKLILDGEFGPSPSPGRQWPPFRNFGDIYYTYQLLLDLQVPESMALRTEPHPRFYTSPAHDVPIAVPATLRTSWWPIISFVVFKSPPEGCTHIFRPGEPFMQIVPIGLDQPFALVPMDEIEASERELQSRRIHASRATLAKDTTWLSATNTVFDGTYRHILGAARAKEKEIDDKADKS